MTPPFFRFTPLRLGVLLLCILAAALLPSYAPNRFYIHLGTLACLNLILVLGLAIIARAGQLSIGHAGFALLGGYLSALLAMKQGWPALLGMAAAGLVCAVVASLLGYVILRLRGVYFVLVAFSFGQILTLLALDMADLTGGANGLIGIPPVSFFGISLASKRDFYPFALACALGALLFTWLLYQSPFGDKMAATHENLRLTESSGVNTHIVQVIAFAIGSGMAGFAGAMSAHYFNFLSPDSFTFWESVSYLTMLVVGGRAGILGPVVGVLLLTPLPEMLRSTQGLQHIIYGAVLVASLLFVPDGFASLTQRLGLRREAANATATPDMESRS